MPKGSGTQGGTSWEAGPLTPADLDAVVEIDRAVSGRARRSFYEKRLAAALHDPKRSIYVGVKSNGTLVGFALARLAEGEFGTGAATATLDAISVDRSQWGKGVGKRLLDAVEDILRHKGVREIVTEVDWGDQAMLHFFEHGGFELAPRVVLDRSASQPLNI